MKAMSILKDLFSPYSNMEKTDFQPLTYIEVKQNKPLIIKLNDKFLFRCNLQIGDCFVKFNNSKDLIMNQLDKLNGLNVDDLTVSKAKVLCFKVIIRLLYEISKQEYKGFFAKRKYYKFINKHLFENIELLIDIFEKVLEYNSALKKKLLNLQSFKIFGNDASARTVGGQSLQDLIEIDPSTGEKRFRH